MFDSLIYIFFAATSIWTLLNPSGVLPATLLVAILILLVLVLRGLYLSNIRFRIVSEDVLILLFLLVSMFSVLFNVNSYTLNINHLYAEVSVMLLYYFCIKTAISNSVLSQKPSKILNAVFVAAVTIAITGIVDFLLLTQGINIADILPMGQANVVAGTGIFSRARGFFVEPTDFALAMNAFFPLLLIHTFYNRNLRRFTWLSSIYVFCLIICRSAAGIFGLFLGILFAYSVAIFSREIRLFKAVKIGIVFIGLMLLSMSVVDVVFDGFSSQIIDKILFVEESASAVARVEAYSKVYSLLSLADERILFGYGTGFLSGDFGSTSHSWYLSVLVEKGIVGCMILFTLIVFVLLRLIRMKSKLKYGLLVSFVALNAHYATQTGFYFPFIWILLVFAQLNWSEEVVSRGLSVLIKKNPSVLSCSQDEVR